MSKMLPVYDQIELLRRGLADELPAGGLEVAIRKSYEDDVPLRVKLGVDPTASRVHLGWAVVLRKLRQFQECGHTAVLIIGDFTAQVGDPSGKSQTRRRLLAEEVREHATACIAALQQILLPEPLEIRYNSEWLASMDMHDVLELASFVTVGQMLERDDFAKRYSAHQPISMIEFMYPLLQAKDSVAIEADVELGGTDQTFNNLMGRHLQQRLGGRGQIVCTVPLLVGTDGVDKMSQSLGNTIDIDTSANDMFGQLMSIPDHLIVDYAALAAWWPSPDVATLRDGLDDGSLHPNIAKRSVARAVVDLYHGEGAGAAAEAAFDRQFKQRLVPTDIDVFDFESDEMSLAELLESAFGVTRGEARRLAKQGGVRIDGEVCSDAATTVKSSDLDGRVVQIGKRRFCRVKDTRDPR